MTKYEIKGKLRAKVHTKEYHYRIDWETSEQVNLATRNRRKVRRVFAQSGLVPNEEDTEAIESPNITHDEDIGRRFSLRNVVPGGATAAVENVVKQAEIAANVVKQVEIAAEQAGKLGNNFQISFGRRNFEFVFLQKLPQYL